MTLLKEVMSASSSAATTPSPLKHGDGDGDADPDDKGKGKYIPEIHDSLKREKQMRKLRDSIQANRMRMEEIRLYNQTVMQKLNEPLRVLRLDIELEEREFQQIRMRHLVVSYQKTDDLIAFLCRYPLFIPQSKKPGNPYTLVIIRAPGLYWQPISHLFTPVRGAGEPATGSCRRFCGHIEFTPEDREVMIRYGIDFAYLRTRAQIF